MSHDKPDRPGGPVVTGAGVEWIEERPVDRDERVLLGCLERLLELDMDELGRVLGALNQFFTGRTTKS